MDGVRFRGRDRARTKFADLLCHVTCYLAVFFFCARRMCIFSLLQFRCKIIKDTVTLHVAPINRLCRFSFFDHLYLRAHRKLLTPNNSSLMPLLTLWTAVIRGEKSESS